MSERSRWESERLACFRIRPRVSEAIGEGCSVTLYKSYLSGWIRGRFGSEPFHTQSTPLEMWCNSSFSCTPRGSIRVCCYFRALPFCSRECCCHDVSHKFASPWFPQQKPNLGFRIIAEESFVLNKCLWFLHVSFTNEQLLINIKLKYNRQK